MMARFRILNDMYVEGIHRSAGEIVDLPQDWIPNAAVEPLDSDALASFYRAGPQTPDLIRPHWTHDNVQLPATFWVQVPGEPVRWKLTGLGANKPPITARKEMT
jgi:hypothetical protein